MGSSEHPHVVVFPFPTQGHINPAMRLAEHLLSAGVRVTFVHTSRSYAMLQQKKNINVSEVEKDGMLGFEVLPDAAPAYDQKNVPVSPSVRVFIQSIPMMRQELEKLMQRLIVAGSEGGKAANAAKPCCLISDSFLPWTQDVADDFGIPRIEFWSSTASVYAIGHYIPELIRCGYIPTPPDANHEELIDIIPGLGSLRRAELFYDITFHPISSPIFEFLRDAFSRGKEAQRVIVHSFYDMERNVIDAMRVQGLPFDPIGPLFTTNNHTSHEKSVHTSLLSEDLDCLRWLDRQPNLSVIYVSFGSNVAISVEEIQELALGLEDSGQPFLLIIRPDLLEHDSITNVLPEGFQSRTEGRGYITSWAPQLAVLAHPAVGGFLSHCGWNSILETIWMGVPVIGCPRESEQNTNLKCLRELNVAIALNSQKGHVSLKQDLVAKAIRMLMHEEVGESVRKSMLKLKEVARHSMEKGQSRKNLEELVEDIKQMNLGKFPKFLPAM